MILFDTSIWIDYIKADDNYKSIYLKDCLYSNKIVVCPPIVQEILQGVISEKKFLYLQTILLGTKKIEQNEYEMSVKAAQMYFKLRKAGITIRKPNDCLIASYALASDIVLVHNDKDYNEISKIFPLKIYE